MSVEDSECAVCGSPLAGGVCAVCLLGVGLEADVDDDPGQVDLVAERPGDVVGRYLLHEKAGEGGFGVVFRAEQQKPMKRIVAVKIIKPGMDTVEVVTRFEAERQALALMDHPHIAKVYDAGTTSRGRPYFVMEYVEGFPLTEFCDRHQLPMRARLELFAEVCRAVQHAHQKGIIHRDLKPGNVLVGMDAHGVVSPKVIDFGVAKAISIELTDKTFFTVFGRMMGTPQYMSPEQTDLNAVDVDTRSDIYSLGVLLYELVTGCVPIGREKLTSASFDEMRKMIREEEPLKPSVRVTQIPEEEMKKAAELRGMDSSRMRRYLAGDFDWVVMKALEKDRGRRYETAQGLANDVTNFLEDLPVTAGPPGAAYRMRKFAHRHRVPVVASLLALIVLIGGSVGITKGYFMVRKEKEKAEEAQASEVEQKNEKEVEHLKLLVEGVWSWWGASQPGKRSPALEDLETVGRYDLGGIGMDDEEAAELRDSARDAVFACILWTDLQKEPLWEGLGTAWGPAALDAAHERGVILREGGRLELREVATGKVLAERDGVDYAPGGMLRISPKGDLVAVATGVPGKGYVELLIWDWAAGKAHSPGIIMLDEAFDFHPDGGSYAVGSPLQHIQVFGRDGQLRGSPIGVRGAPVALKFRPDGKAVAVAYLEGGSVDRGVDVVNLESGKVEASWGGLKVTSLDWAPDGKAIAAGTMNGSVLVLQVAGEQIQTLEQRHGDRVEQMAWSHDGSMIASGSRDEVWLWDGRQRVIICQDSAWPRSLSFSNDDRFLGPVIPGDDQHSLAVLGVQRSLACPGSAGHPGQRISATAWAMDGAVLVSGAEDGLRYWNKAGAALGHDPSVKVRPGGIATVGNHLYLTCASGMFRQELVREGNRLRVGAAEHWSDLANGEQVAVSSDGGRLAIAHDDEVVLVDAVSGAVIGSPFQAQPSTAFVSLSPDGHWMAAGTRQGSGVRLWNLDKPEEPPIELPVEGAATVAFYPIAIHPEAGPLPPMLLTGDATAYRLWVYVAEMGWVPKAEHLNKMANPNGQVASMAFSPRGTVLVACYNRKYLQILHPTELKVTSQPRFDKQWPLAMSFDGRWMVTEATNGRMFFWNLEMAREELDQCNLDWDYDAYEPDVVPLIDP